MIVDDEDEEGKELVPFIPGVSSSSDAPACSSAVVAAPMKKKSKATARTCDKDAMIANFFNGSMSWLDTHSHSHTWASHSHTGAIGH